MRKMTRRKEEIVRAYIIALDGRWPEQVNLGDVAARLSTNTLATWRKRDDHPLKWLTIGGGRIRYRVAAVKEYLATGHRPRPGRPRAQDAAPPRRRAARPRAKADDLAAPQEPA